MYSFIHSYNCTAVNGQALINTGDCTGAMGTYCNGDRLHRGNGDRLHRGNGDRLHGGQQGHIALGQCRHIALGNAQNCRGFKQLQDN